MQNNKLEDKLFKIILMATIILCICSITGNILFGFPFQVSIKWIVLFIISFLELKFLYSDFGIKYFRIIYFIFIMFVIIPFGWTDSGGSNNNTIAYIFLLMICITFFLKDRIRTVLIVLLSTIFLSMFCLEHFYPQIMKVYNSQSQFYDRLYQIPLTLSAGYLLLKQFADAYIQEKENFKKLNEENEQLAKKAELAFLYAQIKPHFLYNSLNTIAAYCEIEPEKAGDLILSLSKHLRGTLQFDNLQKFISFEKEIDFIKAYTTLEKARFNNIKIVYEIQEEINVQLPPIILQPLVENAIIHGIRKNGNKGTILIKAIKHKDYCEIEVNDDGVGFSKEQIHKILNAEKKMDSVGLYNINKRLINTYGTGLKIESEINKGTRVSFKIPNNIGEYR